MHEQSETVQRKDGKWINVYGEKTPSAGQQLPDSGEYDTVDEAVSAAKKRSEDYGHTHPDADAVREKSTPPKVDGAWDAKSDPPGHPSTCDFYGHCRK
jgi:hypothetical protein